MKKILMIGTGGTIASKVTENGLDPQLTSDEILKYIPTISDVCEVDTIQICNIDSTNISPDIWILMVETIRANYAAYDGFVVTHGTDTMAYTAAALSYMIQHITTEKATEPIFYDKLDAKVGLFKLTPGADADILSYMLEKNDAVIVESYGVGGIPSLPQYRYYDVIQQWTEKGKTVVMTTQVPNEGSDMTIYKVGNQLKDKVSVLEAYDMITEAVLCKLMWILGQTADPDEIKELFYTTVSNDILY